MPAILDWGSYLCREIRSDALPDLRPRHGFNGSPTYPGLRSYKGSSSKQFSAPPVAKQSTGLCLSPPLLLQVRSGSARLFPDSIRVEAPPNSNDKDKPVPSANEIDTVLDAHGIGSNGALSPLGP